MRLLLGPCSGRVHPSGRSESTGPSRPCTGLTVQLLLFGPQEARESAQAGGAGSASLPKVSVVDDVAAVRRAFAEAEEQDRSERP